MNPQSSSPPASSRLQDIPRQDLRNGRKGLSVSRVFTSPGRDPLEDITYEKRVSRIKNTDGSVVFEMEGAEIPASWSQVATDIVVSKYFRKAGVPQYDAQGAVLKNEKGEVIGISTAIKSSAQGIGFAIPINVVKDIVVQLKKYGRVLRQWLGIVGDNVSSYMPSYVGGYRKGVIIINMVQGSPADRQGLQIGDIILEANKQPISDVYDLQRIIEKRENKEKTSEILLKIVRNGKSAMIKTIPLEIIPKEEKLPRGHQFI